MFSSHSPGKAGSVIPARAPARVTAAVASLERQSARWSELELERLGFEREFDERLGFGCGYGFLLDIK